MPSKPPEPPEPSWIRRVYDYVRIKVTDAWEWYWDFVSCQSRVMAFFIMPILASLVVTVFVLLPIAIIEEHQKPCDAFAFVREQVTAVDGTPAEVERKVCLRLKPERTLDDLRKWSTEHPEENFK